MWLSHRLFHGDYVGVIYGFRCKQPCLKLGFELSGDICEFSMGVDSSGVLLDVHVLGEGCAMKITRLFFSG